MLKFALRQTCAIMVWLFAIGVAICENGVAICFWCGYLLFVWLFAVGTAICENGVAISNSISRAPCRSQKELLENVITFVNWFQNVKKKNKS